MEAFGITAAGETVHRITLAGGGLTARLLSWGAVLQDLRIEGHGPPLVLGFDSFADYEAHSPWFGAIAGRFANRIAGARFTLDGVEHRTDANEAGRTTLHGGRKGTANRVWTIAEVAPDRLRLELVDPAGHMGFPGTLHIACSCRLAPDARLILTLEARTDAPTPCSLAPHAYFNLDDGGTGDILGHRLTVHAERYLPVDATMIPAGGPAPVAGTPFDFRRPRRIRYPAEGPQLGYDHCFCLATQRRPLAPAAVLEAAGSGLRLEVHTTEPGLQVYAGGGLAPPVPGLGGRRYGAFAGVALEPQGWPDAPNRPDFPDSILRPGESWRHVTELRFARR